MKKDFCIVIPAFKKNAVIPDQLIKKLDGITLIQRAINTAKEVAVANNIYVVTDSEEISLICERNNIEYFKDSNLKINSLNILIELKFIFEDLGDRYKDFILYRANAPLVTSEDVKSAYIKFKRYENSILITLKKEKHNLYKGSNHTVRSVSDDSREVFFEEIKAFEIFSYESVKNLDSEIGVIPYLLNEKAIEIENYQDWWICEKLLQRKRIVINVVASIKIGMGHIYRALSIAHEISNHEIIFVCNKDSEEIVRKLVSSDYKLNVFSSPKLINGIISLEPNIVINDVLNTEKDDILKLKTENIKCVSFEDLGTGSSFTDLTINELYDIPKSSDENILWGYEYYFVRDEFNDAVVHSFTDKIKSVLVTYGGTDQTNLTLITLKSILPECKKNNIKVYIVGGGGYLYKEDLQNYVNNCGYENIEVTFASGVISGIMEKTQIAFSSNGRTVYELAQMNIPAIVTSHHSREAEHKFAVLENGFINLGVYESDKTQKMIDNFFKKLIYDNDYRRLLFEQVKRFDFKNNKQVVLSKILSLIDG